MAGGGNVRAADFMRKEAYWREDKQDDYIHFCFECPELISAKKIGKGTIEEANASGHVRACPQCNVARLKMAKEAEDIQKQRAEKQKQECEKIRTEEKHKHVSCVVASVILTVAFCLIAFSYYLDDVANENYKQGYEAGEDGKELAAEDSYVSGYDEGYRIGYEDGYDNGLTEGKGYTSEVSNPAKYSNTYDDKESETVYITDTGSRYHMFGCQYLSESCYSIALNDAIERGYIACSRCDPPQ